MAATPLSRTTLARIHGLVTRVDGPDVILLLGAGASVKSGIPPAAQLADMAIKHAYCREAGLFDSDPRVRRSDWMAWVRQFGWFDAERPLDEQYPKVVEKLLQPQEERRDFFLRVLREPKLPRSDGYSALAGLVAKGWLRTILTTNFDELIADACRAEPSIRHVQVIRTASDFAVIRTAPSYPQVVHLHGSVEHYTDQNLEAETQVMNAALRAHLLAFLRDHPMVVMGYRGAEPSVMNDLLRVTPATGHYSHGVFWCVRSGSLAALHPNVLDLAERLGGNLQFVEIDGFDEAMAEINQSARAHPAIQDRRVTEIPPIADMDAMPDYSLDDIDTGLAERQLRAYAEQLPGPTMSGSGRTWIVESLRQRDLVRIKDEHLTLLRAAALLFGARGNETSIEIRHSGRQEVVAGNVFYCSDAVQSILAEHNPPFRLKGPTSETVRRYPPLALKELVVNALAHRDHTVPRPVVIDVGEDEIRFISPGGLVAGLDPHRLGTPGVRAYRNPVVADLLYGTGLMDKAGSGLSDVSRWARETGGDAYFQATGHNSSFEALIRARPEKPDPTTGTAERRLPAGVFTTNVLPVSFVSGRIDSIPTLTLRRRDIYAGHVGELLPGFALHDGRLLTFSPPGAEPSPFRRDATGQPERIEVHLLEGDPNRERLLVQLLNSCLIAHARARGLLTAAWKLYFPSSESGPTEVTYQGRVRRATRTVTRPIVSQTNGRVLYWEHQSVRFRLRRFGREWGLMLVPTWTFTRDGWHDLIDGARVSKLAIRRSARDFNPQVATDLQFWAWALTGGESIAPLTGSFGSVTLASRFIEQIVGQAPESDDASAALEPTELGDEVEEEISKLMEEEPEGEPK